MNENDAEIVATCEAAVTRLTENGWEQGTYSEDEFTYYNDNGVYVVDYSTSSACLAGALVLASVDTTVYRNGEDLHWDAAIRQCPTIPAVAAVIQEKYPDMPISRAPSWAEIDETEGEAVIYTFNDDVAVCPEDVIEVLRETIKRHTSEVIEP